VKSIVRGWLSTPLIGLSKKLASNASFLDREVSSSSTSRRRQLGFDPARLVFSDESNAKTNMTRLRGRALRGKRLYARCTS
jgi:hypothetical protein